MSLIVLLLVIYKQYIQYNAIILVLASNIVPTLRKAFDYEKSYPSHK
jgi:hypothetical protein